VGTLIEIGAGFHPMLTGRENIYVNGAILGMSKYEMDEKFDDIVAFADIGDFLDTPVKNCTFVEVATPRGSAFRGFPCHP